MQVIGFNFTKISAERKAQMKQTNITSNMQFTDLIKDKLDVLKEGDAVSLDFQYNLTYENPAEKKKKPEKTAEISFEGKILISVSKEESQKIVKAWKKKELPPSMQIPLFNLIIRRCAPKALTLQSEMDIPSHLRLPSISRKQ